METMVLPNQAPYKESVGLFFWEQENDIPQLLKLMQKHISKEDKIKSYETTKMELLIKGINQA